MPPMLYVALDELMSGGAQKMFAGKRRFGMDQRHHILQLIAETVGTTTLIKASASPVAAAERLI